MHQTNPYAPPTAPVADVSDVDRRTIDPPPFFAVSLLKLAVLSVCTFGLYEIYWFYRNWTAIKVRERRLINPHRRALFSPIYCYQCFARVNDFAAPGLARGRLQAFALAAGWIMLVLAGRLPDPYSLISTFTFVFLLPVQRRANAIDAAVEPRHDANDGFSALNWVAIAVGGAVFVLGTLEWFVPLEE
jgi:hypothetical protein